MTTRDELTQWMPTQGMNVVGSDDEKIGEVDTVEQNHFVVRKGFFFPEDHFIPLSAVASYDDDNVYLNVTKDQALEQQWTAPPVDGSVGVASEERVSTDTSASTGDMTQNYAGDVDREYDTDVDRTDADITDRDSIHVDVHEEELAARTREVDRGDVRVRKDVVAEEQSIDVPITEEHVNVSRRDVDREVGAGETAFEEGTIDVPVRGEEVDIEKRTRVTGEVDIDKTAETHTERVSDTVRREEVSIEGEETNDTGRKR